MTKKYIVQDLSPAEKKLISRLLEMQLEAASREISIQRGYKPSEKRERGDILDMSRQYAIEEMQANKI